MWTLHHGQLDPNSDTAGHDSLSLASMTIAGIHRVISSTHIAIRPKASIGYRSRYQLATASAAVHSAVRVFFFDKKATSFFIARLVFVVIFFGSDLLGRLLLLLLLIFALRTCRLGKRPLQDT